MNSEKILQRIRMLMKESFFYKKELLISAIQTPKKYPYVQIYSALTQLIEDNNEFITDKYGRSGRLVNIGEYYLFQPIELKDKNIINDIIIGNITINDIMECKEAFLTGTAAGIKAINSITYNDIKKEFNIFFITNEIINIYNNIRMEIIEDKNNWLYYIKKFDNIKI
jgi:hypothetical protein